FNTALRMNEALLAILEKKDFEYITIKEICEKAGVNRSTFYLHYQNTRELLDESIANMYQKFLSYFEDFQDFSVREIRNTSPEHLKNLIFVKDEYLRPYLEFVRDHRRIFKTAVLQESVFDTQTLFDKMFQYIFNPILASFHCPESERLYIMKFYISGLIAVIMEWIEKDCRESIEQIINIMKKCIFTNNLLS
ncbi:MAG: TetR/AcrR family transcriptional regulator, partial [Oscillospiraceae bacterium]|nr:TetR/AcrR family transcriptional regulator [Oscillospiraceae bacterium]